MLVTSTARLRYVSIPPRKMRIVADAVKGMQVEEALGVLNFIPRIAAHHLAKTVKSAAANALSQEGTDRLHPEDLIVKNIMVDPAPSMKRVRFRSMGRVYRIRKRFCHVTVFVEGHTTDEQAKAARGKTKTKAEGQPAGDAAVKDSAVKATPKKTSTVKKTTTKKTGAKAKKTSGAKTTKPVARKKPAAGKTAGRTKSK